MKVRLKFGSNIKRIAALCLCVAICLLIVRRLLSVSVDLGVYDDSKVIPNNVRTPDGRLAQSISPQLRAHSHINYFDFTYQEKSGRLPSRFFRVLYDRHAMRLSRMSYDDLNAWQINDEFTNVTDAQIHQVASRKEDLWQLKKYGARHANKWVAQQTFWHRIRATIHWYLY